MKGMRLGWAAKAIVVIIFTSILFRCVSATNHTVGGLSGWEFNSNLQVWSDSITFHPGDNLVFKYGPVHDVLEVNRVDFRMCRTINPIITHNDGSTVVPLTETGTRYFICGRRGHCTMGLRLRVPIVALRSAPAPANNDSPAPSGSSSSPQPGGGGSHGEARRRRRPRPPPPPRFHSHSPPSPSGEHKVEPPPVEGQPPQVPRSASSSSAGDGGMMIMMPMITGGLVYSLLTFRAQVIFA